MSTSDDQRVDLTATSRRDAEHTSPESLDEIGASAFPDAAVRELIVPLENLLRAAGAESLWLPGDIDDDEDAGCWTVGWDEIEGRRRIVAARVTAAYGTDVLEGPMPFIDVRPGIRVRLQRELLDLMKWIGERLTPATVRAVARS